jgi:predicted RNA-binding Zn-ribbon protein involved in translation (DUF1610 family)
MLNENPEMKQKYSKKCSTSGWNVAILKQYVAFSDKIQAE